ncbi:MAG: SatD family protein [Thiohalocapsa sp.]
MTTSYLAIIGDVIASRAIADRPAFQRRLRRTLEARNAERRSNDKSAAAKAGVRDMAAGAWETALVSPYTLTLGDEFQVLLRRASGCFLDLLRISADLYPEQMRFALALGEVDTAINPEQAIGMDGSAFHRARAGIDQLKADQGRCRVDGLTPQQGRLINNGLTLAFGRLDGARGSRLPLAAGLLAGEPVAEIARRLGKSEHTHY